MTTQIAAPFDHLIPSSGNLPSAIPKEMAPYHFLLKEQLAEVPDHQTGS